MKIKVPIDTVSFQHSRIVKQEEIDELKHVNNIVYLQWVQEISGLHWHALATDKIKSKTIWIALRHEIDYINPSFLNDNITIYTWIDQTKGVKSIRIVHMYCGDKLLAKAKTTWVLLDAQSLKPKRIGKDIQLLFEK